jgi:hypothetical protein
MRSTARLIWGGTDLDIPVTVANPAYDPKCTDEKICPPKTITGQARSRLSKSSICAAESGISSSTPPRTSPSRQRAYGLFRAVAGWS